MSDETPYRLVPLSVPADHPILDAGGFTDLGVLGKAGPSAEQLAAALAVIKASGYSVAEATAAHDQAMAALRASRRQDGHRCHRCDATPTHQWTRRASEQEAEAWHTAREQHIRAHNDGRPAAEYVSDRSDTVTLAVHGCDEHVVSNVHLTHDADCGGHGACACGGDRD